MIRTAGWHAVCRVAAGLTLVSGVLTGASAAATTGFTVSIRPSSPAGSVRDCLGSVLSPLLVLTSAQCAEHAVAGQVMTADGTPTAVARIASFDWGRAVSHAQEHDLALLVLRSPLPLDRAATLDRRAPCAGVRVKVPVAGDNAKRWREFDASLPHRTPAARPFSVALASAAGHAAPGAGVTLNDGTLIGVVSGVGAASGRAYFARFDQATAMLWIQGVVAGEGGVLKVRGEAAPMVPPLGAGPATDRRGCAGGGALPLEDGSADAEAPVEDIRPDAAAKVPGDPGSTEPAAEACGPPGGACARAGMTCGSAACSAAGFCNFLVCDGRRWAAVEAPPPPPPPPPR